MRDHKDQKAMPISIRLSAEERSRLEAMAGRRALSEFIRQRVFEGETRSRRVNMPKADMQLLAQLLALLGQSDLGAHLREIAYGIKSGSLAISPDVEEALFSACASVIEMRNALMVGLGLIEGESHDS